MNIFKRFKAFLRYNEAVRQADKAHQTDGQRYYVMPTSGNSGQLIIMNRTNFRKLKLKGYINSKNHIVNLEEECFYCTPYRNGNGLLHPSIIALKRRQYFAWLNSLK